uniref:Uncharacterized protein n=1 Tax=viral metagenome TaxID=1070528 RepID=A0A6M3LZE0_9ZZZZ
MAGEKCPIDLKPMATWVQEPDPKGICRECLLAPVLQWYREELNEKGHTEFVNELDKIAHAAEVLPLQLCQEFDKIKSEVEESLRERLEEFDCTVQAYKPDDDS